MIEITTIAKGHLQIVCSSEFDHLDQIVDETEAFTAPLIDDEELAYKVVLLVSEAVTNAIEHGNAMDAGKQVKLDVVIDDSRAKITVEDEGEGFKREEIQNPTDEPNLLMDDGRGIFFIEEMADKVDYELNGRRIHIYFRR